jgi:hypothetical protein
VGTGEPIFDGVVENGGDFTCGRRTFAGLIWITSATPLRPGVRARNGVV